MTTVTEFCGPVGSTPGHCTVQQFTNLRDPDPGRPVTENDLGHLILSLKRNGAALGNLTPDPGHPVSPADLTNLSQEFSEIRATLASLAPDLVAFAEKRRLRSEVARLRERVNATPEYDMPPSADEVEFNRMNDEFAKRYGLRLVDAPARPGLEVPEIESLKDRVAELKARIAFRDNEEHARLDFQRLAEEFEKRHGIRVV